MLELVQVKKHTHTHTHIGYDFILKSMHTGAHARLALDDGRVFELVETASPHAWVSKFGDICRELSKQERLQELVLMAMRTSNGMSAKTIEKASSVIDSDGLTAMISKGLLMKRKDGSVFAANKGMNVLDGIMKKILK